MTDYMVVSLSAQGLDKEDKSKCNGGLKYGVGRQSASQPWQRTEVRSNQPTTYIYDAEGKIIGINKVAHLWLMSGDFQSQVWWGDEQATKIVCADALVAAGVKDTPAVVNTIIVKIKTHEQVLTMLHDNAVEWGEEIA